MFEFQFKTDFFLTNPFCFQLKSEIIKPSGKDQIHCRLLMLKQFKVFTDVVMPALSGKKPVCNGEFLNFLF